MGEVLFNTNEVATMLQVDKSTVKRWTTEGKLKCFRTPGGHRKFRAEDLYHFMLEYDYAVASLTTLKQLESDEAVIRSIVRNKEYSILNAVCFSTAIKGKKADVVKLFTEAYRAGMSPVLIYDEILQSTLKRLRETLSTAKISISEYQLAMNALSSSIILLNESVSKLSPKNKTIICFSLESETINIELEALVSLLEIEGFDVLNLGTGDTLPAALQLIERIKPYSICLYASSVGDVAAFALNLSKIFETAHANNIRMIVGGSALKQELLESSFHNMYTAQAKSFKEFIALQYDIQQSQSHETK